MSARVIPLFAHVPAPSFIEWYEAYPRKAARADAEKAHIQAIQLGHTPHTMIQGARAYAEMCRKRGTEKQYMLLPASFLRGERFMDEEILEHIPPTAEAIAEAKDKADKLLKRGIYRE